MPLGFMIGGGFYEDSGTTGLAGKSHDIGRQVAMLPPRVRSIQSEIENFPYQRLKKAAHITVLEAASHMGAGCSGAAFNVLSGNDEPLDEFEPLVARILQMRPFYDLMAKHFAGRSQSAYSRRGTRIQRRRVKCSAAQGLLGKHRKFLR